MAQYPTVLAGDRLSAQIEMAQVPVTLYKAANTDRASTITLVDDPDLTASLAANAVYRIEFYLHMGAATAGDVQTMWTVPAGATGNRSAVGPASAEAGTVNADPTTIRMGVHGYGTAVVYGSARTTNTNLWFALEESIVTTTTAGTCAIQWAQAVSNATASRMGAGSYMVVTRLA